MRLTKLTIAEHDPIAKAIFEADDAIAKVIDLVNGKVTARFLDRLINVRNRALGDLRSELDDRWARDCRDLSVKSPYYPGPR